MIGCIDPGQDAILLTRRHASVGVAKNRAFSIISRKTRKVSSETRRFPLGRSPFLSFTVRHARACANQGSCKVCEVEFTVHYVPPENEFQQPPGLWSAHMKWVDDRAERPRPKFFRPEPRLLPSKAIVIQSHRQKSFRQVSFVPTMCGLSRRVTCDFFLVKFPLAYRGEQAYACLGNREDK